MREGTDTSQGKGQLLSNIDACLAVVDVVRTTLGPRGMDKLIVSANGQATISNDGATILKLLEIVHPAARSLLDIARAQDAEVGDGTTSVVVLAGELMKQVRGFVEEGVAPQVIIRAFRRACTLACGHIKKMAVEAVPEEGDQTRLRELLEHVAATAMNSKLISAQQAFFKRMVVDAVLHLDAKAGLDERLIGMKRIPGGALEESQLVDGVAFKKTFVYAGFEQQPKSFDSPKILCLNLELELKAERDNAEVRVDRVEDYQAIVDAEWQIIGDKLERIAATGAKIVLSRLAIGDLAMQFFADRGIFCAGRVPTDDMQRVLRATGASLQASVTDLDPAKHLGTCGRFEERQLGGERYNLFTGCPQARTCTLLLRGGSDQFIAEVERSLHDAIMVVRRALQHRTIVAGGGAVEMALAMALREAALKVPGKQQLVMAAYAQAFEALPRQLCDNAGFDANRMLTQLRKAHAQGQTWAGVDIRAEAVTDNMEAHVWEPALVKLNMVEAATEAACLVLSVDLTVQPPSKYDPMKNALPGLG